jgi:glycosyltransferase involved in cell wall biosynthesis
MMPALMIEASLPSISVVIPTLNSGRYLSECLQSLIIQDYPRELLEIIVVDGGSQDQTLDIARQYGAEQVLENLLVTGEAGKARGVSHATNDLILMVDSDNVLVGDTWLRQMVRPIMEDPSVISSECLRWEYRREDHFVNRYQALTGINDPMSLFIGNYDRWSELRRRWTDYPMCVEEREGWYRVELAWSHVPTMGANGYIVRREAYSKIDVGDYLFDIDAVHELVAAGLNVIARVDVPIRHYYCDSVRRFYQKTRRRTDDFFYFRRLGMRTYPWTSRQRLGVLRFIAATVLLVPLMADVVRGHRRVADPAWLFHLPACWITLIVYATGALRGAVRPARHRRTGWSQ